MKESLKIIKIGGNIIDDQEKLAVLLDDFSKIPAKKILVHGGGTIASTISKEMGIKPKMHKGRRITNKDSLDIATMIYAGLLSKKITAELQAKNCNAIGLSGVDANIITAIKREVKEIDFGYVGDVINVDSKVLSQLIDLGLTPVFNAISHDKQGQLLNINADTIASELAVGLVNRYEIELIYLFEKKGVLSDVAENIVIPNITKSEFKKLQKSEIINSGMIPKLDNCFYALKNGVKNVKIAGFTYFSDEIKQYTEVKLKKK